MKLNSLAVFCGSKPGLNPNYSATAKSLAHILAKEGITLVYGGARVGIMGVLADAMLEAGGKVIGVMPTFLVEKEIAHSGLTKLYSVDSMHERKALIAKLSEGVILLPGAAGSLEEFFEIYTWAMLGLHQKPCGILNIDGYYDHLLSFLDVAVSQEFLRPAHRQMIVSENDPQRLLDALQRYEAPSEIKWMKSPSQT